MLVIEDENSLSKSISTYLHQNNFICDTAFHFFEAREKMLLNNYDCIVLDITLPNGNGLDLLSELKMENRSDGILIISAKNSVNDRIHGLEIGA